MPRSKKEKQYNYDLVFSLDPISFDYMDPKKISLQYGLKNKQSFILNGSNIDHVLKIARMIQYYPFEEFWQFDRKMVPNRSYRHNQATAIRDKKDIENFTAKEALSYLDIPFVIFIPKNADLNFFGRVKSMRDNMVITIPYMYKSAPYYNIPESTEVLSFRAFGGGHPFLDHIRSFLEHSYQYIPTDLCGASIHESILGF